MLLLERDDLSGHDFKIERVKRKVKLKEVAEFMQCSPSYLSKWENEHIDITADKIAQYSYFINTYHDNK